MAAPFYMRRTSFVVGLILLVLALPACGLKKPLRLPDQTPPASAPPTTPAP